MVKNNHNLKSFACKQIVLGRILVDLKLFRIPECNDIDYPFVIGSPPVQEAVKILVFPVIIKNTCKVIKHA